MSPLRSDIKTPAKQTHKKRGRVSWDVKYLIVYRSYHPYQNFATTLSDIYDSYNTRRRKWTLNNTSCNCANYVVPSGNGGSQTEIYSQTYIVSI